MAAKRNAIEKTVDGLLRVLDDTRVTLMQVARKATGGKGRASKPASAAKRRTSVKTAKRGTAGRKVAARKK